MMTLVKINTKYKCHLYPWVLYSSTFSFSPPFVSNRKMTLEVVNIYAQSQA